MSAAPVVVMVGPSGAGKDTLLARVRERFRDDPGMHVVRRVVTRAPEAGGEPHESVDEEAFAQRVERGAFAVHWDAHGLRYGVPVEVRERVDAGCLVVVNGSRAALPRIVEAFPSTVIVHVSVSPATLVRRLAARGRESEAAIRARLERAPPLDPALVPRVRELDNDGPLDASTARLVAWLEELRGGGIEGAASDAAGKAPATRSRDGHDATDASARERDESRPVTTAPPDALVDGAGS